MSGNRGKTSLKRKRSQSNPMRDYDRLPPELRVWVSEAILPWRAKSVKRAYDKALSRTGRADLAIQELDRLQDTLVALDAQYVWGATSAPHK